VTWEEESSNDLLAYCDIVPLLMQPKFKWTVATAAQMDRCLQVMGMHGEEQFGRRGSSTPSAAVEPIAVQSYPVGGGSCREMDLQPPGRGVMKPEAQLDDQELLSTSGGTDCTDVDRDDEKVGVCAQIGCNSSIAES
jgi:hypothetical protein